MDSLVRHFILLFSDAFHRTTGIPHSFDSTSFHTYTFRCFKTNYSVWRNAWLLRKTANEGRTAISNKHSSREKKTIKIYEEIPISQFSSASTDSKTPSAQCKRNVTRLIKIMICEKYDALEGEEREKEDEERSGILDTYAYMRMVQCAFVRRFIIPHTHSFTQEERDRLSSAIVRNLFFFSCWNRTVVVIYINFIMFSVFVQFFGVSLFIVRWTLLKVANSFYGASFCMQMCRLACVHLH